MFFTKDLMGLTGVLTGHPRESILKSIKDQTKDTKRMKREAKKEKTLNIIVKNAIRENILMDTRNHKRNGSNISQLFCRSS